MRVNRDEVVGAAMQVYIKYITQNDSQQLDTERLCKLIELQTGLETPDSGEPDADELQEAVDYSATELINAWARCPELPLYKRIEKIVEIFIRFA
jgi:hypothetical protein